MKNYRDIANIVSCRYRRHIAPILTMIAIAALSFCGPGDATTNTPASPPSPTAKAGATTPSPAATVPPAPTVTPRSLVARKSEAQTTPAAAPSYPDVPGIVDVSNRGWPREIETSEGLIRLEAPPQRILTYSLGHDEIVLSLVGNERIAAVGKFTGDESYSNVADWVDDIPVYEKGAENVLAQKPDVFIASKFTDADIVELVKEAGIPVVRPSLENSSQGNIPNILLLGYLLGVEDRALELVAEIEARLKRITDRVPPVDDDARPTVISITRYSEKIYVPGLDTTVDGIIETAGGTNAAARDGLEGIQKVSLESVAAMNPDVILITQTGESGGDALRTLLLEHPALVAVPAVVNDEIHIVGSKLFITLSHWNVRGIEQTALVLFPDRFAGVEFSDFEPYLTE